MMAKSPLRVLHVGKFYPPVPGGMERVVQLLCETKQDFIESRVLVANARCTTTRELWQGVHVTRVGSIAQIGSAGVCPTFPLELARIPRDVTVIHEPNPLALVSDWLTAQRGPLVVWFHSELFRPRWKYRLLYRPLLRRTLERCTTIVVSSARLADHASELKAFRHKCCVIPIGIDVRRLSVTPAVAEKVSEIDRRFPGPRVLFVGRLVPYKGVDVLVRSMTSVDASALIVGDGPMRAALQKEAVRCRVADKVTFLGQLSDEDVVAHLHAADVFVLPSVSDAETFGVAQLEAMACGKPVVSTNLLTGVPWVNRDGETGLVVRAGEAGALSAAVTTLLADESLRARMGACGRRRVDHEFTAERMTARAAALYRQVATASEVTVPVMARTDCCEDGRALMANTRPGAPSR